MYRVRLLLSNESSGEGQWVLMSQSKEILVRLSVPLRLVDHESVMAQRFIKPEGSVTAYLDISYEDITKVVSQLQQERQELARAPALESLRNSGEVD